MSDCIFCKVSTGEIGGPLVHDGENVVGFADIHPLAPVHVLFIPRKHIASLNDANEEDVAVLGELVFAAKEYAKKVGIAEDGYKILMRTGEHGGQEVPHIHLHLIGGGMLHEEIRLA